MKNLKEIKNKTLLRLAELKKEKEQVSKELVLWKAKEQKAKEFSQVLYETREFTIDHLDDNIEKAREEIKQSKGILKFDYYSLEYRIRDKVEFDLYYQGLELFKEKILKDIEYRTRKFENKLGGINNEIEKLEKRTAQRSQQQALRKQNKETNHV